MRLAVIGDGESPHVVRWLRALAALPELDLWLASSRGIAPALEALLPATRRLALGTVADAAGGNVAVLATLPRLGRWLREVDADWLNPHYLTSHGTLALLARRLWRLRARIAGSAWGSDILVTPARSPLHRWHIRRVLAACAFATSDSGAMTARMRELGAREVMTFPIGLEALPPAPPPKAAWSFFANRALEPVYAPERVIGLFAAIAAERPQARLVVANDGSLRAATEDAARARGLRVGGPGSAAQVEFVGRLDPAAQARCYAAAEWYLSLPRSDSTSVSVLEAMAHGCIPILSDLAANRALVEGGVTGAIAAGATVAPATLEALRAHRERIAAANRHWVAEHGLIGPGIVRFAARLREGVRR